MALRAGSMPLRGALWTIRAGFTATFLPPEALAGERLVLSVTDPVSGVVPLSGLLHDVAGSSELVIALHGLGGSADSAYLRAFAATAAKAGIPILRWNARGADLQAPDIYHAGLTSDLEALLASPALARFDRIALAGFSLGGATALRWAAERGAAADSRVAGIAAVCSPLDLELGATALDRRSAWIYRSYVLPRLRRIADAAEERGAKLPGVAPAARRRAVVRIREFDSLVVAPRFGFASAEDYYANASVAPILGEIAVPTWIVEAENDPMVPAATVRPALARLSPTTRVTWTARGGHVGFPADLDLGRPAPAGKGLHPQILDWLLERLRAPAPGDRSSR